MPPIHRLFAVCALLGVAGCSGSWFGGDDEARLPGERQAIRTASETATVNAAAPLPPAAAPRAEWSHAGGAPSGAGGHIAAPLTLGQVWSVSAGSGSSGAARIVSPPVVAGGRVYALDAAATVRAIDANSGAAVWSTVLTPERERGAEGFGGGVAASGGQVFATTGFGTVSALDAASGAVGWTTRLDAPVRAAPAAASGRVFVVTRAGEAVALDAATGDIVWRDEVLESAAGALGGAAPAISGGTLVVPFSSGEIAAFTASNGRSLWSDLLSGSSRGTGLGVITDVSGDPAIVDGLVTASTLSGALGAFDLGSGERRWTRDIGSLSPAWAAGSVVYVVGSDGVLHALSRDDGRTYWSVPLGAYGDPEDREDPIVWSGPVLAGGSLLLTSSDGRLITVAPDSGAVTRTVSMPSGASTSPVVAGGTVYVLGDNGRLTAWR